MAYQALYRVWRSQRFDTIVGQQAITQTLKNAIVQNQISHAYLFTGPRGTGKTSAAKIFAKAINCPNNVDGEPCNECEMCRSITNGSQEDVIEIDAASNNGVEEIRFIRDRANYAPTQATYKIYIIDEVHMLSTGAFNALLKTLEEPKKNVIFILATTEPHKIPATIISRTQRFDFKRIGTSDILDHLMEIVDSMSVTYDPEALQIIARAAEGGMRDALSILDQALAFSDEKITTQDALEVTGSVTSDLMDQYLLSCFNEETTNALVQLEEMLSSGKETRRLLENLLFYCRDLLIYQQAPTFLENESKFLTDDFKKLAQAVPSKQIYEWIEVLNTTQNDIRFTTSPTIYLEVATVKLATNQLTATNSAPTMPINQSQVNYSGAADVVSLTQFAQLQREMDELRKQIRRLEQKAPEMTQATPKNTVRSTSKKSTYRVPVEMVTKVLSKATKERILQLHELWEDLLDVMATPQQKALLRASQLKAASDEGIVLSFDYEIICQRATTSADFSEAIVAGIQRFIPEYAPTPVFIVTDDWPKLRNDFIAGNQDESSLEVEDSTDAPVSLVNEEEQLVTKAQELFGDLAKIEEN